MNNHAPPLDRFYPIVPDAGWVERIVPLGVKLVQLRLKDADAHRIRHEITRALTVCRAHQCQLVVNDHWQAAIECRADYVHLGQEDLAAADLAAIRRAGMRLGLSSHSLEELAIARAANPDYIALGPVYPTTLKAMKWAPQGLHNVGVWADLIRPMPLVAIGGLTLERAPAVMAAGAASIAVVTDFVMHPDPEARVKAWLAAGAVG